MSFADTRYEHIVLDEHGIPHIAGTTMKVVELVTAQTAYGWSAEELHIQFPHLSLGQIHSALAYYWDHRDALDCAMSQRLEEVGRRQEQMDAAALHTLLRKRAGR